ncbi:CotH kinase family protein [Candidatus Gracilibacteria bacterium]|nr:CotH kinase family protein [Candidatus Gracilibacteria bacterium]
MEKLYTNFLNMLSYQQKVFVISILGFTLTSCGTTVETQDAPIEASNTQTEQVVPSSETPEFSDWTEQTHSNDAEPNYEVVLPQNEVNRIDIVIAPDQWEAMQADMTSLFGEFGNGARAGADDSVTDKPIYVETDVYFNGIEWYNVGMKYKGHSSLNSAWSNGNYKLPFKLKFDEFEDDYEELDNQRFYGFKKLSFSSNYLDDSLLHEKLASETFEEAGLISPNTAFYSVYVDYGQGSKYFGLYTAVENVDDTLIDQFGDDSGNVYEAEGEGVTLAKDTYDLISTHYEKKTNEDEANWSDIENLSNILNSDLRLTDTETWKENLEEVFDVPVFLNWLAVNSTIQNWDTYGVMTHNFYLYNNPETGKLTWIPWDNNESFAPGKRGLVTLTANSVGEDWPLIRYLLDDEEYRSEYVENVDNFTENVLSTDTFKERVTELHELIEPYVIGENGEQTDATHLNSDAAFTSSLSTLLTFIDGRIEAGESLSLDNNFEYSATAAGTGAQRGGGVGGVRPERPEGDFGERPAGGPPGGQ